MALSGAVDPKAALAEIVSPQTLLDIEEFIKPQFPPIRRQIQEARQRSITNFDNLRQESTNPRRRIVKDGHGRWREVKPRSCSDVYRSNSSSTLNGAFQWSTRHRVKPEFQEANSRRDSLLQNGKSLSRIDTVSPLQRQAEQDTLPISTGTRVGSSKTYLYDHLSMATRSNIFPGLGNNQWDSTTARTFVEKAFIPPAKRSKFFGIQTDEFGQWSAANVYHEKMKKAWNDYLINNAPKSTANWKPSELFEPKDVLPKLTPKPKKPTNKPKRARKETAADRRAQKEDEINEVQSASPAKPPIDIPADDGDDDFWDFFDKPFNKPK